MNINVTAFTETEKFYNKGQNKYFGMVTNTFLEFVRYCCHIPNSKFACTVQYLYNIKHHIIIWMSGLPLNILFKFFDFSLTFDNFTDLFGRPILAIFIHQKFENFVQIFMLVDLIFKEKSQTIQPGN